MKVSIMNVIVVENGVVNQNIAFVGTDKNDIKRKAETMFRDKSLEFGGREWKKLSVEDQDNCLMDGYFEFEGGSVCIGEPTDESGDCGLFDIAEVENPLLAYALAPASGILVVIKEGESGYYPYLDYGKKEITGKIAKEIMEKQNKGLGIPKCIAEMMLIGSVSGWHNERVQKALKEFKESRKK